MMLTWDAQGQHGTTARCITLTRIAEALRKVIESKRSNGRAQDSYRPIGLWKHEDQPQSKDLS